MLQKFYIIRYLLHYTNELLMLMGILLMKESNFENWNFFSNELLL